jgi:hypothetical protein
MAEDDYVALKACGFSPLKALEIALDASRGDKYAAQYVRMAHESILRDATALTSADRATVGGEK